MKIALQNKIKSNYKKEDVFSCWLSKMSSKKRKSNAINELNF